MSYPSNEEMVRCKRMADHVWNYLAITDPAEFRNWIVRANKELSERNPSQGWQIPPWCPQDGEGAE